MVFYSPVGEPLGSFFEKLSPAMRLKTVINLAKLMSGMHNMGIGHKDPHLCNFAIDPETKRVTVLDAKYLFKFPKMRSENLAKNIFYLLLNLFERGHVIFSNEDRKMNYTYTLAFFVTYMHHYVGHNALGPQIKKEIKKRLEQYLEKQFPEFWLGPNTQK